MRIHWNVKPLSERETKAVLILLGANSATIFALLAASRWREKQIRKTFEQYNIITDFGIASFKALQAADPEAADKIAVDTKFAFIVADNEGEGS